MRSTFLITAAVAALVCASGATAAFAGKGVTEKAVYSFAGGNDGGFPQGGLVESGAHFFGVTTSDGSGHNGVIFEATRNSLGWTESALYSFTGGTDGGIPEAGLMADSAGNLYGTTYQGGSGNGVVFMLHRHRKAWQYSVLWTFAGGNDGAAPSGRLSMDASGNIYGTTTGGGTGVVGTVFELSPPAAGSSNWTETVLYNFTGNNDGGEPMGNVLLGSDGNLYGTTSGYGQYNYGVVYKLTPNGNGWTQSVLHAFNGTDGSAPRDGLMQDPSGALYGTTSGFGEGYGNVFSLNTDGSNYNVLYNVPSCTYCYSGNGPWQTVSMDSAGNLYGTTYADGQSYNGEVFRLTPEGNGQWAATVLYAFPGGAGSNYPYSTVLVGKNGRLYGTSYGSGGMNGFFPGNIWEIKQ